MVDDTTGQTYRRCSISLEDHQGWRQRGYTASTPLVVVLYDEPQWSRPSSVSHGVTNKVSFRLPVDPSNTGYWTYPQRLYG